MAESTDDLRTAAEAAITAMATEAVQTRVLWPDKPRAYHEGRRDGLLRASEILRQWMEGEADG